uniref:Apple domain-containing protein n=1 Tax=Macrostomum lignano TaxID=282301 RepID=A0A1I8FDU3_9PLAT
CLICAALCRQFHISDLGCFVDGANGVRDVGDMKHIGLTRIGSSEVSPIFEGGTAFVGSYSTMNSRAVRQRLRSGRLPGAAPAWECIHVCSGNSRQNCERRLPRNECSELSYTGSSEDACMNRNVFVPGNRTFVELNIPDAPRLQNTAECRAARVPVPMPLRLPGGDLQPAAAACATCWSSLRSRPALSSGQQRRLLCPPLSANAAGAAEQS